MVFREVSVIEIREVLRAWLAGKSERAVAAQAGVDRETSRRYVEAAVAAGLSRGGGREQLTDELIGQVVSVVRPVRPDGHGAGWAELEARREQITAWVGLRCRWSRSGSCCRGRVWWWRSGWAHGPGACTRTGRRAQRGAYRGRGSAAGAATSTGRPRCRQHDRLQGADNDPDRYTAAPPPLPPLATVADVTRPPLTTADTGDHAAAPAYLIKHTRATALIVLDAQTGLAEPHDRPWTNAGRRPPRAPRVLAVIATPMDWTVGRFGQSMPR
jgi:hypothetical protein